MGIASARVVSDARLEKTERSFMMREEKLVERRSLRVAEGEVERNTPLLLGTLYFVLWSGGPLFDAQR